MFCPYCGKEIEGVSKFCPFCGKSLQDANATVPQVTPTPTPQKSINQAVGQAQPSYLPQANQKPRKKKRKKIAIVPAVFIALVIIIKIISGGNGSSNESNYSSYNEDSYQNYSVSQNVSETADANLGTYTIMVYCVGSDLESKGGAASSDIREMLASKYDASRVNIVIYAGGSSSWNLPISSGETTYVNIVSENGVKKLNYTTVESARNMGVAETYSEFLNYAYENYPADHYALINWDHGIITGDGARAYGKDELFDDYLSIEELKSAMENSPFNADNKLDWVGFDACLMGSVEMAQIWTDYANYLLASEEAESGYGWDYSFLSILNKTNDPVEIAKSNIDSFIGFYENYSSVYGTPDATLSLVDLSKTDELVDDITNLFNAIKNKVDSNDLSFFSYGSTSIKEFGLESGHNTGIMDIGDLCKALSPYFPDETSAINSVLDSMVVYNKANVSNCSGLTVFYPLNYVYESYGDSVEGSAYGMVMSDVSDALRTKASEVNVSWDLNDLKINDNTASLQLTQDQIDNLSYAYYTVLHDTGEVEDEAYTPIMSEVKIVPDDNGTLSVDLTPDVFVVGSELDNNETDELVYNVKQLDSREDGATYQSVDGEFFNAYEYMPVGDFEFADIFFNVDNDRNVRIKEALSNRDDIDFSGKTTIEAQNWDSIGYNLRRYIKSDGCYKDWDGDGYAMLNAIPIGGDTRFELKKTSDLAGSYIAQIVLVDKLGNEYASSTFDLKNKYDSGITYKEIETKNGKLGFEVYDKYARLIGYEGGDTEVTVPEKVDGVKVTVIGEGAFCLTEGNDIIEKITLPKTITAIEAGAFSRCYALTEINIPDKVKAIPDRCFCSCLSLEKITLPKKLKYIGRFAFAMCDLKSIDIPKRVKDIGPGFISTNKNLQSITFNGKSKNRYYKVKDKMLLTKDGKHLLAGYVINPTDTTIVIPEGVEIIEDFAMCGMVDEPFVGQGTTIESITLPSTLRYIGELAFRGVTTLDTIDLPDSLEVIANAAFSSAFYSTKEIDSIHIGANVKAIEKDAFAGYIIKNIDVDKDNMNYSSVDGVLMDKGANVQIYIDGREVEKDNNTELEQTYYDAKGNKYSNRDDVIYYDKNGDEYIAKPGESTFIKQSDKSECYYCYVDRNGVLVNDESNSFFSASKTTDGKLLFGCVYDVYFNKDGKLVRESEIDYEHYYDMNGNAYSSLADVPLYDKDGNEYKAIADENDYIDKYVNVKTNKVYDLKYCYITEDGYFYNTNSTALTIVYLDSKYNEYHMARDVYWDENGNIRDIFSDNILFK